MVRSSQIGFLRQGGNMSANSRTRRMCARAAACALGSVLAAAGSAATPQDQPSDLQTAQAASAAAPAPEKVFAATPPTPEELGDSLMVHQRYQAAIEAYKRGSDKSAQLWNKMGIA